MKGLDKIMKKKKIIIIIIVALVIIAIGVFYKFNDILLPLVIQNENLSIINNQKNNFTRTYEVLNIEESNDENYLYLTIRQFQQEEVETVKVLKNLANSIEINKNYEFTFKKANLNIEDSIKSIFENAELISIKETDKTGLEQIQEF